MSANGFAYLDDIEVVTSTFEEHLKIRVHLKRQANVKLDQEKCQFARKAAQIPELRDGSKRYLYRSGPYRCHDYRGQSRKQAENPSVPRNALIAAPVPAEHVPTVSFDQ